MPFYGPLSPFVCPSATSRGVLSKWQNLGLTSRTQHRAWILCSFPMPQILVKSNGSQLRVTKYTWLQNFVTTIRVGLRNRSDLHATCPINTSALIRCEQTQSLSAARTRRPLHRQPLQQQSIDSRFTECTQPRANVPAF